MDTSLSEIRAAVRSRAVARGGVADTLAGFAAGVSIFEGLAATMWHPFLLATLSIALGVAAAAIAAPGSRRLAVFALALGPACCAIGVVVAVTLGRPVW